LKNIPHCSRIFFSKQADYRFLGWLSIPHVSWPWISTQRFQRFLCDSDMGTSHLGGKVPQKQGDIFRPLPQRRQVNRNNRKPVVKILGFVS
jgi:hypothetical protein